MKYWVEKATGRVAGVVDAPNAIPHSDYIMVEAVLPAPIEVCVWSGSAMVVDASKTNARKDDLKKDVWRRLQKPFTITINAKDHTLSAQQCLVLVSMEARANKAVAQNDATWTLDIKADDGTVSTLSAANVIDAIEKVGNRLKARWNNIIAKEQALIAAAAADLATFDPDVN